MSPQTKHLPWKLRFQRSFLPGVAIILPLLALGAWLIAGSLMPTAKAVGINRQINYQGKLASSTGVAIPNGSYNFHFSLWDASSGGNMLWEEAWSTASSTSQVSSTWGVFSAALGTYVDLPASVFASDNIFLQVGFDSDGNGDFDQTFSPRKRLTASPYAFNSETLDGYRASTTMVSNTIPVLDGNAGLTLGAVTTTNLTVLGDTNFATLTVTNLITTNNVELGVVASGTWQGDIIGAAYGGTGQDSTLWSDGFAYVSGGVWQSTTSLAGAESDPFFTASPASGIAALDITNWNSTYNLVTASSSDWTTAFNWGDHALAGYLTTTTAANTYLTIDAASSTYLTINNASNTYLTVLDASNTYLTVLNASNTYLSVLDASSTYLTINNASNTYLTVLDASNTYLTVLNASNTYLTANYASDTYLTINNASNTYLSVLDASNTYLTVLNASNTYLTADYASNTYVTLVELNEAETDPIFSSSAAYAITSTDILNWNTTYNWGNHASSGYLTILTPGSNIVVSSTEISVTSSPVFSGLVTANGIYVNNGLAVFGGANIDSLVIDGLTGLLFASGGTVSTITTSSLGLMAASADNWVNTTGDIMTGNLHVSSSYINVVSSSLGYWLGGQRFAYLPSGVVSNTAIGIGALASTTTGFNNTAVGYSALTFNNSGNNNTALGSYALYNNSTNGDNNTALGTAALFANTSGEDNTAIGSRALYYSTSGNNNTANGREALFYNTSGNNNTALGFYANWSNTSGNNNTAIGLRALASSTGGNNNVALGYYAGSYEIGSSAFYVDNQNRGSSAGDKAGALLYGTFNGTPSLQTLRVNASTTITQELTVLGAGVSSFAGVVSSTGLQVNGNITSTDLVISNSITLGGVTRTNWPSGSSGTSFWETSSNGLIGYPNLPAGYTIVIGASVTSSAGLKLEVAGNTKLGGDLVVTGNLGIGLSAPSTALEVVGTVSSTGLRVNGNATVTSLTLGALDGLLYASGGVVSTITTSSLGFMVSGTDDWVNITGDTMSGALVVNDNITASSSYINVVSTSLGYWLGGQKVISIPSDNNLAVGINALASSTSGTSNVAVGFSSLMSNTVGVANTAIGESSLYKNVNGSTNVAVGSNALYTNVSGNNNTALGFASLYAGLGSDNLALGFQAGQFMGNGNGNLFLGSNSGQGMTDGSSNILIGYNVDVISSSSNNFLNIGNTIYGDLASGYVGIGTTTPQEKLVVDNGSINAFNVFSSTSYDYLTEFKTGQIIYADADFDDADLSVGVYGYATSDDPLLEDYSSIGVLGKGNTVGVAGFGQLYGGAFRGTFFGLVGASFGDNGIAGSFSADGENSTVLNAQINGTSSVGLSISDGSAAEGQTGIELESADWAYGLKVANSSSTGYSIYSDGGINYFSGSVGIGSSSPGSYALAVTGDSYFDGNVNLNNLTVNNSGATSTINGSLDIGENLTVGANTVLSGDLQVLGTTTFATGSISGLTVADLVVTNLLASSNETYLASTTFNGDINVIDGYTYKYNGTVIARASTTASSFFLGNSGASNTGGYNNAFGEGALSVSSGDYNNAFGGWTLLNNTTGDGNSAFGNDTMYLNETGDGNSAFGGSALYSNISGSNNVAVGNGALYSNVSGIGNVAIGSAAGNDAGGNRTSVIDDYSIFIGTNATRATTVPTSTQLVNAIAIGYEAQVGASNTLVLGGLGANAVKVGIGTPVPSHQLTVVGDAYITGPASLGFGTSIGDTQARMRVDKLFLNNNYYPLINFYNTGAVTGTVGAIEDNLIIYGSSSNPGLVFYDSGADNLTSIYYDGTNLNISATITGSTVWNGNIIGADYGGTGQDTSGWTGFAYINGGVWESTTSPVTIETDPIWSAASGTLTVNHFTTNTISQWYNNVGYITSTQITNLETDPVFTSSAAAGISSGDITNWDSVYAIVNNSSTDWNNTYLAVSASSSEWTAAYNWGNHATAGYLTTTSAASIYLTQATASSTYLAISDAASIYLSTSTAFGGDVSGTYNNLVVADNSHDHNSTTISNLVVEDFATNTISQWYNNAGYITSTQITNLETDPVFSSSAAASITTTSISNWDSVYAIVNNSSTDWNNTYLAVSASSSEWTAAYNWGNHATAGYLTTTSAASIYLTQATASSTYLAISDAASIYLSTSTAFGGDVSGTYNNLVVADNSHDHNSTTISNLVVEDFATNTISQWYNNAGYITSTQITNLETDPVFSSSAAASITTTSISNWDGTYTIVNNSSTDWNNTYLAVSASSSEWTAAYNWGNHALAGYLTTTTALSGYVPYSGATTSLDLGSYNLSAALVSSTALQVNGTANITNGLNVTGTINIDGSIIPRITNNYNLGHSNYYWNNLYVNNAFANNISSTNATATNLSLTNLNFTNATGSNLNITGSLYNNSSSTILVEDDLYINGGLSVATDAYVYGDLIPNGPNSSIGSSTDQILWWKSVNGDNLNFTNAIGSNITTTNFVFTNATGTSLSAAAVSAVNLAVANNATITGQLYVLATSTMSSIIPGGTITNNISTYSLGASSARWKEVWAETINIGTSTWSINNGADGRLSIYDAASGGGAERFSILTNGRVGIGGITAPTVALEVNGVVSSTGLRVDGNVTIKNLSVETIAATDGYGTIITGATTNAINGYVDSAYSAIIGGFNNTVTSSQGSAIVGGSSNFIGPNSSASIILGGTNNIIDLDSDQSAILAGNLNSIIYSDLSVIIGGQNNVISSSTYSTILGGNTNSITSSTFFSTILGGKENVISSNYSGILGGYQNVINFNSEYSSILGGRGNIISSSSNNSSILSGYNGMILDSASNSIIAGGIGAVITADNNFLFSGGMAVTSSQGNVASFYGVDVGIGTTTPISRLHIVDTSVFGSTNVFVITTSSNIFRVTGDGNAYADGSFTGGGADYAEYFYTRDTDLASGEAVCVDVTKNNAVVRCTRAGDDNIMGIVSTKPAIVGNYSEDKENNPSYKIVAMLGQIPTKASTENGEIRPGDYLTAASIPGYVMKAGAGDATVGVALESLASGDGLINVMISRRNKSLTVEQIEDAVTKRITDMELEDEVNIMLADTIKSYDFTDDIAAYLNPYIASVDAKLALLTDTLSLKVGELASTTLGADNALSSQIMAASNLISVLNEQVSTTASNLSVTNAKIEGLDALVLDHSDRLTALELFTSSSIADLQSAISNLAVSTSSSLEVSDNALTAGTLVVTEAADFIGTITVRGEANFEAKVTFGADAEFKGHLIADKDTAGTAMIAQGTTSVEIIFNTDYERIPKVIANLQASGTPVFASFVIAEKTISGFKIILAEPATQDLYFDWFALATNYDGEAAAGPIEEEPVIEEPVVEEPIVTEEEPVVEEPVAEEPIVEELPLAEEPVAEGTDTLLPAEGTSYQPAPEEVANEPAPEVPAESPAPEAPVDSGDTALLP